MTVLPSSSPVRRRLPSCSIVRVAAPAIPPDVSSGSNDLGAPPTVGTAELAATPATGAGEPAGPVVVPGRASGSRPPTTATATIAAAAAAPAIHGIRAGRPTVSTRRTANETAAPSPAPGPAIPPRPPPTPPPSPPGD